MAEDINLPDLISHLQVNLAGTSGAIADGARQGSSVGAAVGRAMQQNIADAIADIPEVELDADSSQLDRDLDRVRRELAELAEQRIGVDISIEDALSRIEDLEPHLERLQREHPVITVSAAVGGALADLQDLRDAARAVDDEDVDIDVEVDEEAEGRTNQLSAALGRLAGTAGALGGVAVAVGGITAALGAAIPVAAGLVATIANIAPAAGVAVTAQLALRQATGAVQLAMVGMDEALTAALDPSKAEEFSEALEKLAPEARQFAQAVRDLQPEFSALQQTVQNEMFRGLAEELERTSSAVMPVLRTELSRTAAALNQMAVGVAGAARGLAKDGTLGQAMGSASTGLHNLAGVPGVVATALGQIAAAAGPSFEGLTLAAASTAGRIGEKLGAAFESGALQQSIENAITLIGDMAEVAGNVGGIISGVFGAAQTSGGGMVGVLQDVTAALEQAVNSPAVQDGLSALFETMGTLGTTVAPLLGQAMAAIGPVLVALAPPAQRLITALGSALSPIIEALGPVLEQAAVAVGVLVDAAAPLLPVMGRLVAALLPALEPLLAAVQTVFVALAPVVGQVAMILEQTLAPVLAALPGIVQPLADLLANNLVTYIGILGDLLVALGPSLVSLGQSFAQVMVAMAPLITAFGELIAAGISALAPLLPPLIGAVARLAAVFSGTLAAAVTGIIMPALRGLAALLRGDFSTAWRNISSAVANASRMVISLMIALPSKIINALAPLGERLAVASGTATARLVLAIREKLSDAVAVVRTLPGRAASALGDLGSRLFSAGSSLISGFIDGIRSRIGAVRDTLAGLTDSLPNWKGPKTRDAKILTPAGRLLIEGFIRGINDSTAKLRSRLESITKALPANVRSGIGRSLAAATADLRRHVAAREAVITKLAAAQKRLADLQKERTDAAGGVKNRILGDANIVSGNETINSVAGITIGLQQAVARAAAMDANIATLRKRGLRADLLQDIGDAGLGGAATAQALARATPAELQRINQLQSQLAAAAGRTGTAVGDALYGAGIRAAQGLVAGLQSQEAAIERTMQRIAKGMLTTIKKTHKTRSPSRAFWDIGVMDGEGLRLGFLAMQQRINASVAQVASGALAAAQATSGIAGAIPSPAGLTAAYAGTAASTTTITNNLYGTDATPEGMLRALTWRGLVGRTT